MWHIRALEARIDAEDQMAYNKSKLVANAQKLLHQGKIAQAIQEYQQILKHEPKDQATLMTVGDLYVRQGDTFQALEYFERLAQIYLADGFVSKAIAIYKKIAKLAPEETRPVEKLAELYVQQGVLSEARPIYLQLADLHQRAGRQPQAQALLKKLLEAEPDNLRVLTRVAELALSMNQPADAAAAFRSAAEQLHNSGNHAEAIKYADRVIKIDVKDRHIQIIKARSQAAMGQAAAAISLLSGIADLEQGGDAAEFLIHLYLQESHTEKAVELASQIFARSSANYAPLRQVCAQLLQGESADAALPLIDMIRSAMIEKGEHDALGEMLTTAGERLPDRVEPQEWLVDLYKHTSDSFRLPDALLSLARICERTGQRERALEVYQEILERDPENEMARMEQQKLNANPAKGAQASAPAPAATPTAKAAVPGKTIPLADRIAEPKTQSPAGQPGVNEPALDEETQRFVTQSLTDVDLFASYGLTQKAIDLLEVILQRAPDHTQTLERLLDHYLGAGDEKRTAELAARLEQIHISRGDTAAGEKFADLRQRFEQASQAAQKSEAPPSSGISEFSIPEAEVAPAEANTNQEPALSEEPQRPANDGAASQDAAVHELDLSEEWAALATEFEGAASEPSQPSAVLHDSAGSSAPAAPEFEVPAGKANAEDFEDVADLDALLKADETAAPSPNGRNGKQSTADYVLELDTPQHAGKPAESAHDFLEALSSDLDAALPSLKKDLPTRAQENAPKVQEASRVAASSNTNAGKQASEQAGPLAEIFDEFRSEVGEEGNEEEDLETHYNLGIAYREMGLIEEAISEFQKVAKGSSKGQAFRYAMQCCTLLGLAFMEKGQPSIAATWYERALAMPGLDQESILALRYDLGVAQELAGDMAGARKSFSQVYGMNIDYRDVAERLSALGNER